MQDSYRQLILLLIALFTILQFVILFTFGYTPYPDSDGYLYLAQESLHYNEAYPITSLLNDYPFLWNIGSINITAISLALFNSIIPLLAVYALMKGITGWLFYGLTRKICGIQTAFIALIIYIIYPANYGECTSLLSELPFMFFIMSGIYLAIVKDKTLYGGILLAVANWFRPMGIVFLVAVMIFFLFKWQKSLRLFIGYMAVITIIGCATMYRTGLFLYQAKSGWMALMDYSSDHSPASLEVLNREDWNVAQKDSAWQALFFDWLKDHPAEYVKQIPVKLANTYASDNVNMCTFIPNKADKEYMYEEVSMKTLTDSFPKLSAVQWLTVINLIIYLCIIVSALCSLYWFNRNNYLLPVSIIVLGTLLLLFVGHGESRFHIPFMPFFIILASIFITKRVCRG